MSKALVWTGRVLSALPSLLLLASSSMKLIASAETVANFEKYGYNGAVVRPLGALELSCAILYLVPQTAVFGAALATGYLGGAVATHLIADEAWFVPIVVAVLMWAGLGLREPRLLAIFPIKRD